LLNGKHGLKYAGIYLESMSEIARANKNKSLVQFSACVKKYDQCKKNI
jgi:hypothetical protein